jgi:hypothetical protein
MSIQFFQREAGGRGRLMNSKSENYIMSDTDMEQVTNIDLIEEPLNLTRTYDPLEPIMSNREDIGRMFSRIRHEIYFDLL